jgi:NtrC-family two-component system sensor histidine kinase KinB
VQEIITYAVHATKAAADQKQVSVKVKAGAALSVFADSEKTAWVLTNLLSNAIRYSHENTIVYIDVQQQEDKISFAVTDTGQGIAPEYTDKVFDRYFRIPGTKKEGTGLGLSISKEFIEAQGGSVSVKTELGTGSTFSFVLKAFNQPPLSV